MSELMSNETLASIDRLLVGTKSCEQCKRDDLICVHYVAIAEYVSDLRAEVDWLRAQNENLTSRLMSQQLIDNARDEENEACAKLCDSAGEVHLAAAIRARMKPRPPEPPS